MKKLSKEKRNQLVLVIVITVGILVAIGFVLIRPQYDSISKIARDKRTADDRLQNIQAVIKNISAVTNELNRITSTLATNEEAMASGDLYSWTYDTIRRFKQPYKVEIPEIGHPTIGDMDLIPAFPYKQAQFAINGTAYYHDLGKFIADFENSFPRFRMVRLVVEPANTDATPEKLFFRMEIIALVKPSAS